MMLDRDGSLNRSQKIANEIFEEWNTKYQYPMSWEVRVAALKRLIAEAIKNEVLDSLWKIQIHEPIAQDRDGNHGKDK